LKRREIKKIDICGDGSGYGLIISKHYSSEVQIDRRKHLTK